MPPARKLFLDLDGVLADFDRGVRAVTGKRPEALSVKAMWRALARGAGFCKTRGFVGASPLRSAH